MHRTSVPCGRRFEAAFSSSEQYANPYEAVDLSVAFTAPDGRVSTVDAFWDGEEVWRVRFAPDQCGEWTFTSICSNRADRGLHGQFGAFVSTPRLRATRFDQHGPLQLSVNRRYLCHDDTSPFFWLADTAWNGPLLATEVEWQEYVQTRTAQGFTAVQWVPTQWVASPTGDRNGQLAYTGETEIEINPAFFQRLDQQVDAITAAGLLSVPVLLWAVQRQDPQVLKLDPGTGLRDDQAVRLARYMVARWQANPSVWILNGDGDYRGERSTRWCEIGEAVFGDRPHAPVAIHPGGRWWVQDEFIAAKWLDIVGYQSGHSIDDAALAWHVDGPPANAWPRSPARVILNLEPCYEYHNDMSRPGERRIDAHAVRRALYTSLLISPTAGVTYGGHGVWGWDDGNSPPTAHANTGIPYPWRLALTMPAARQVSHLAEFFASIEWWRLLPAPRRVLAQAEGVPGSRVVAAMTPSQDCAVVYAPAGGVIELDLAGFGAEATAFWVDPQTGERAPARRDQGLAHAAFSAPSNADWLLIVQA